MCVKSRSQGLDVDLAQLGLEPGPPDPEAKSLPIKIKYLVGVQNLLLAIIPVHNYLHL